MKQQKWFTRPLMCSSILLSLNDLKVEVASELRLNLRVGKWVFFPNCLATGSYSNLETLDSLPNHTLHACRWPITILHYEISEVSWRENQNYYRTNKLNSFNGRLSLLGWAIHSMPIQPTKIMPARQTQAHIEVTYAQHSNCCFPLCNELPFRTADLVNEFRD